MNEIEKKDMEFNANVDVCNEWNFVHPKLKIDSAET
jgi:hypothetical protein